MTGKVPSLEHQRGGAEAIRHAATVPFFPIFNPGNKSNLSPVPGPREALGALARALVRAANTRNQASCSCHPWVYEVSF